MRKKPAGFTLFELMITVAAILAAIAYPSFSDALRKSRRADAVKGLLSMQLKQEEYRITNSGYVDPTTFNSTPSLLGSPTSDYYKFTVSAADQTTYSLKAEAKGPQSADTACAIMGIDKGENKTPNVDCSK